MFNSWKSLAGFLAGLALTVGLLLTPHLLPWGYRAAAAWPVWLILALFLGGAAVLAATLWYAGRLIEGAVNWRSARVITGAVLIAIVANTLYSLLVELFGLGSGWRALVAVLGVPIIYGNLAAVLGRMGLKQAMLQILTGALTTMGAGFIVAALIRGW